MKTTTRNINTRTRKTTTETAIYNPPKKKLTVESELGSQIPYIIVSTIVQNMNGEVRVLEVRHVIPSVREEVGRLLADGQEHVHRRLVPVLLRLATDIGVGLGLEVLSPQGDSEVCMCIVLPVRREKTC